DRSHPKPRRATSRPDAAKGRNRPLSRLEKANVGGGLLSLRRHRQNNSSLGRVWGSRGNAFSRRRRRRSRQTTGGDDPKPRENRARSVASLPNLFQQHLSRR